MNIEEPKIKEAILEQLEKTVLRAKEQLETIQCTKHGSALKKLEFQKDQAKFDIQCCCPDGEKLIEAAIEKLI